MSQSAQTPHQLQLSMFVINVDCSLNSTIRIRVMMRSNILMLVLCSLVHLWAVHSRLLTLMLTTSITMVKCICNICCYGRPMKQGRPLYFCPVVSIFYLSFFSSPNLSGHRLDVYHTSTHGVALVRI